MNWRYHYHHSALAAAGFFYSEYCLGSKNGWGPELKRICKNSGENSDDIITAFSEAVEGLSMREDGWPRIVMLSENPILIAVDNAAFSEWLSFMKKANPKLVTVNRWIHILQRRICEDVHPARTPAYWEVMRELIVKGE